MDKEDVASSPTSLVDNVSKTVSEMEELLERARNFVKESLDDFMDHRVECLGGLIGIYHNFLTRLCVKTRLEAERLWEHLYRYPSVQSAVEDLWEVEEQWDRFLHDVDKQLNADRAGEDLRLGSLGPVDVPLVDAGTGRSVNLQDYLGSQCLILAEIQAAGGRVMVVSFGSQTGAQRWLQDTSCSYHMLLDQERKLYGAFGLGRSVSKVWSVAALTYYAEQKAAGRTLPNKYENVEDDPHQMGGDFIFDPQGHALMVHCSKVSTDRPEVTTIISVLKEYQSRGEPTSKRPKKEES
ncbi:hypothetical protein Bbelb_354230 [Branchiostoma belcheri]|nr:hypothetical protein Bbelb_354230 [Branchiostoma belcheri]